MNEVSSTLPYNYEDFIKSDLFIDWVNKFLDILVIKEVIKSEDKDKIIKYFSTLKDGGELKEEEISNFLDLLKKNEIEKLWNRFSKVSKKRWKIGIEESMPFNGILREIFWENWFSQIKKYVTQRVIDVLSPNWFFEIISQYIESWEVEFLFEWYWNLLLEQVSKFPNLKVGRCVYKDKKNSLIYKNQLYDINHINDVIPYWFFKKSFEKNRSTEYKNFSDIPFYTQTFYLYELGNYFVLLSTQKIQWGNDNTYNKSKEEWQEYTLAIYVKKNKTDIITLLKGLNQEDLAYFFGKLWEKYAKEYHAEIMRNSDEYHKKNITSHDNNWSPKVPFIEKKRKPSSKVESLELFKRS